MSIFLNTFGGSAVSPADVAYAEYSFATNLTLYWPAFSYGQTDVAARFMNLTATASSLNVYMPDATLTSVGQDVIVFNAGSNTLSVVDFSGGAIATIAAGKTYYILLNDNATQAGTWQTVQFGIGTSSADAAALAGAGLLAAAGMLNVNTTVTTLSGSTTLTSSARSILQVWTGGAGTITLPSAASVGNGFFFPFANNGSGSVTISAADNIDGAATSIFTMTQSSFIVSSGTTWYTVGKGTQNTFAVTLLNLNVAGSANVTETASQAQNIIQQFTGALTGNINVIVPNTVQLYYVFNNTSGAFTLTVKTAAGTGIAVDQGSHSIVYCDGTNVVNAFTSSFGGAISISAGSAAAPNLSFIGSATTGLYSPAANQVAITANGKEVMNFTSAASAVNWLESTASATGVAVSIAAKGGDTDIGITLSPKGAGSVNIAKAAITGGTISGISFTGNIIGNASTATALQNARTIGGVSFDGTANITVASATAGFSISGGNLVLGANSLTLTGSIGATGARSTKGWFTDLESTNAPTIGGAAATGSGGLVLTTSPALVTPNIGTPSAGILTSCTGLPIATGVSGLGTGIATFLATPSSANLRSAITDESGTGALLFAGGALGAATATSINGLTITSSTGTLTITNGKTASVSNTLTLTGTDGSSVAFGAGGTAVYLGTASVFTAQQNFGTQTLTDAASISWNLATQQTAKVTLGGNRTLAAPSNLVDGGTYILRVIQDGTGSRTLAYNAVFRWPGGTAPVLSTAASAVDILTFVSDGTHMDGVIQKAFS